MGPLLDNRRLLLDATRNCYFFFSPARTATHRRMHVCVYQIVIKVFIVYPFGSVRSHRGVGKETKKNTLKIDVGERLCRLASAGAFLHRKNV